MSTQDELFFTENVVNVNRMVRKIIAATIIVPISFLVLTLAGIWIIPYGYSLMVLGVTIFIYLVLAVTTRNPRLQIFSMYFSIISAIIYVDILDYNEVIIITITYCCASFLSCLYYNKRFTRLTSLISFLAIVVLQLLRSFGLGTIIQPTIPADEEPLMWFISHTAGMAVEFVFVYLISTFLASRNHDTIQKLVRTKADRDIAYDKLAERNKYIIRQNGELEAVNAELNATQYKIIQFVAQCLGSHDLYTGRHLIHTQKYVDVIAKELRAEGYYEDELADKNIELLSTAAFLHDIGKIHVPEGILNKIGKFSPEEFDMMKCHTTEGKKLLEFLPPIDGGKFNDIAMKMAYHHHEKWDGTGYPNGLAGTQIPLCARIMAAADVLDALLSQRLYKDPMTIEETMDVFEKSKGGHFEPCIAQAVINCRNVIELMDKDFKTSEAATNAQELEWWRRYHENLKV
ncbi:MAG: HD domain-containing protein [Treponema sp.]|nr:HD domain-containing protein [Treponema sp.]